MSERRTVRVRDVMTKRFQLVDGLITVEEGVRIMRLNEVRALIIDKRHDDDEYGLVLLSDIAKNVLAKNRSPERVSIYEIMAKPIICVEPKMDIRYCARLFEHFGLAIAPVIDDREVIGVVSYHEIVLNGLMEAD
jgi:predicted transcriptional regulator